MDNQQYYQECLNDELELERLNRDLIKRKIKNKVIFDLIEEVSRLSKDLSFAKALLEFENGVLK